MLSGIENLLFLKKMVTDKTLKEFMIVKRLLLYIVFPMLILLEFTTAYYFSMVHLYYNNEWTFIVFIWLFFLIIVGNYILSYFVLSEVKKYLLKTNYKQIILSDADKIEKYIRDIKYTTGVYIDEKLKNGLHSQWVLGNDCDRFLIIEKELSLSPDHMKSITEYYESAKRTYEKMETIF